MIKKRQKNKFSVLYSALYSALYSILSFTALWLMLVVLVEFPVKTLFAQNELSLKKLSLIEEIKQLEQDIQAERKNLITYKEEKGLLIKRKAEDISQVKKEIGLRRRELAEIKNDSSRLEGRIERSQNQEVLSSRFLQEYGTEILASVKQGIPFDGERRAATLQNIISDLQSGESQASEGFTRLFTFLSSELAMGYDSELIRTILPLQGKEVSVDLLRIGRLFFAVDDGDSVYLYKKQADASYRLDTETDITFEDRKNIQRVIRIISGQEPSDIISIPLQSLLLTGLGKPKP